MWKRGLPRIAAAWLAAAGCAGIYGGEVESPDVQLADMVLLEATVFEQRMRVDLRIINPNDFDLKLDGIRFELEINDDVVARGVSDEDARVPRLGDALVSVATTTSSIALIRQIVEASSRSTLSYRLSGDHFLRHALQRTVAFEKSGSLPLRSAPPASP